MQHEKYIRRAVELSGQSMKDGGGPFGAVIVRNGEIIAEATNRVTHDNDPTAHAEVVAIRKAGKKLGNFQLDDCIIYSSCEPCPMCLGAIYWSHIPQVYYSADRKDAEDAGFDDKRIYEELNLRPKERSITMKQVLPELAPEVFKLWNEDPGKIEY